MAGLSGNALGECKALEDVGRIMERLEQMVSFCGETSSHDNGSR